MIAGLKDYFGLIDPEACPPPQGSPYHLTHILKEMRKANDQFHQQVPTFAPSSHKKSAPKVIKEVPAVGGDGEGTKYTVTMTIDEMKNFVQVHEQDPTPTTAPATGTTTTAPTTTGTSAATPRPGEQDLTRAYKAINDNRRQKIKDFLEMSFTEVLGKQGVLIDREQERELNEKRRKYAYEAETKLGLTKEAKLKMSTYDKVLQSEMKISVKDREARLAMSKKRPSDTQGKVGTSPKRSRTTLQQTAGHGDAPSAQGVDEDIQVLEGMRALPVLPDLPAPVDAGLAQHEPLGDPPTETAEEVPQQSVDDTPLPPPTQYRDTPTQSTGSRGTFDLFHDFPGPSSGTVDPRNIKVEAAETTEDFCEIVESYTYQEKLDILSNRIARCDDCEKSAGSCKAHYFELWDIQVTELSNEDATRRIEEDKAKCGACRLATAKVCKNHYHVMSLIDRKKDVAKEQAKELLEAKEIKKEKEENIARQGAGGDPQETEPESDRTKADVPSSGAVSETPALSSEGYIQIAPVETQVSSTQLSTTQFEAWHLSIVLSQQARRAAKVPSSDAEETDDEDDLVDKSSESHVSIADAQEHGKDIVRSSRMGPVVFDSSDDDSFDDHVPLWLALKNIDLDSSSSFNVDDEVKPIRKNGR